jgi:hypothetical protein
MGAEAAKTRTKWRRVTLSLAAFCFFLLFWTVFGYDLTTGMNRVAFGYASGGVFVAIAVVLLYVQLKLLKRTAQLATLSPEVRSAVGDKTVPVTVVTNIATFDRWIAINRVRASE